MKKEKSLILKENNLSLYSTYSEYPEYVVP